MKKEAVRIISYAFRRLECFCTGKQGQNIQLGGYIEI